MMSKNVNFGLFTKPSKDSKLKLRIHKDIKKLADASYQGIIKLYSNSHTPVKNTRNNPLTKADKEYNGNLLKQRVRIDNVNFLSEIF